ncbi:hypothetical protein, partial [Flagellimonas marinaquae]
SGHQHQYECHYHSDGIWRLPKDWDWPDGTARVAWQKWNLRNTITNVPPLKLLSGGDFSFLDKTTVPRQKARKTFGDLKFLCKYIETKAQEAGIYKENMTEEERNQIYGSVASNPENGLAASTGCPSQAQWRTALYHLRKKDL